MARLEHAETYRLQYLNGASRATGFVGFGRMNNLHAIYESAALFPPFANRIMSRSRPEYSSYLRWADLNGSESALDILAVTGGLRGTDSIEIFSPPTVNSEGVLQMNFFVRGLSYLPKFALAEVSRLSVGTRLRILKDIQNEQDGNALVLSAENPMCLVGYLPKYYCRALERLLSPDPSEVAVRVKKVNEDAPAGMRLLCELRSPCPVGFDPLLGQRDFVPLARTVSPDMTYGAVGY